MKNKNYWNDIINILEYLGILLTVVCYIVYRYDGSIKLGVLYNWMPKHELIVEFVVTVAFPICFILLIKIVYLSNINNLNRIREKIASIPSKKLRLSSIGLIEGNSEEIVNKFITLLSHNETEKILWELEQLDLSDLEIQCICCENKDEQCSITALIKENLKNKRRVRITSIAKSLIHYKCHYWTTEINKPSQIMSIDKNYYEGQLEQISKYKPNYFRLLILSKKDLKSELITNKDDFNNFVKFHLPRTVANNKSVKNIITKIFKPIPHYPKLKIIAFDNNITEVFNGKLDNHPFYDFAISKRRKKITVFAQKRNNQNNKSIITSFDSENPGNANIVKTYFNCYNDLLKKGLNNSTNGVIYSDIINSFNDVEKFITNLN